MKMRSNIACLTIAALLSSQIACALNPPVMAWREILRDQPIHVRTHSGEEHHLQSWRVVDNVLLVGSEDSLLVHIQLSNVKSVARDDTPTERAVKTSIFVAGVVGAVVTFIYFLWALRGPFGLGKHG